MCRCAAMPGAGMVWNGLRCALAIIRGRIIFNRAMPERLRTLRHCIFTGGVVMVNCICSTTLSAKAWCCGKALPVCALIRRYAPPSPDRGKASAAATKLPAKAQSVREETLPRGELSRSD